MLGSPRKSSCERKDKERKYALPHTRCKPCWPIASALGSPPALVPAPTRISLAKSVRPSSENFLHMLSFSSLVTAEQCGLGFLIEQNLIGNRKAEDKFESGMAMIMRK